MDRRDDARSKKIIFVSSCLLNTNNKVQGLARYPGMCKEVFDTLNKYGLGINQMDCPETLYLGISRRTLYRLVKNGAIPVSRVGRRIRVSKRALDAAVAAGLVW